MFVHCTNVLWALALCRTLAKGWREDSRVPRILPAASLPVGQKQELAASSSSRGIPLRLVHLL